MSTVHITIPLVPPSVNHYKMRTRKGVTFVSAEAKAFKQAVAVFARGMQCCAKEYSVIVRIFLGKGQKGDIDNFLKVVLDGLTAAGVIHSDAAIVHLVAMKGRDARSPRTEIEVGPGVCLEQEL
jgi:Holliday junction resolvase RusA-like endonuclease